MGPGAAGPARIAVYWAPELDDPLHAAGSAWLGRDAESGAPCPQPALPRLDLAAITADARGYGLHCTLKPPFRLARSWAEVLTAAEALAARTAPFDLPPLAVMNLDGFVALLETAPCPAVRALADAATLALDDCRAPPETDELARRRRAGLTPEQDALLLRWGYPYVLDEWRFHVTLTRRLTAAEQAVVLPAAVAHLGAAAARARSVTSVCLFAQAAPGAPFLLAERLPLRG